MNRYPDSLFLLFLIHYLRIFNPLSLSSIRSEIRREFGPREGSKGKLKTIAFRGSELSERNDGVWGRHKRGSKRRGTSSERIFSGRRLGRGLEMMSFGERLGD